MNKTNNDHRWIATPAPLASRYDDIFFITPDVGWAVNGNGQILKTENGGGQWQLQRQLDGAYLRCIGMTTDGTHGWVGCVTPGKQLYRTSDGGKTWTLVDNLPKKYISQEKADAPSAVCGLWVLDKDHVFAAGTNYPERPARFFKTDDGGKTWIVRDMEDLACILVDIYFQNDQIGWVVGGRSVRPNPRRDDVVPTILKTTDGGKSWTDMLKYEKDKPLNVPLGEWGWKIQFLENDPEFGVVACENLKAGAIFITEDGGDSWRRQEIRDECHMINENLEGIGFWNRNIGWVGGWGDATFDSGRTSETRDGGKTWIDMTGSWPKPTDGYLCPPRCNIGQYINRFRFVGQDEKRVAYASGNTVYKYTNQELYEQKEGEVASNRLLGATELKIAADRALVPLTIPEGATSLSVVIYDRFAGQVRTLLEEQNPAAGDRSLSWDLRDDNGQKLPPGQFMVRVTCDGYAESRLIFPERTGTRIPLTASIPHQLRED
ncbi:MAG: hypothetical protein F6K22_15980 [Okeania sp. SIO2F4]|uniref:YCF48-related protein n=1 Tax=Okeania sp. SIO2F4 TaxID=2607790 RepID=UPI00142B2788|nr:YCF48-related protein [Okeania sp. SIO2F4]NES04201.1 hypothetical protein [Okeania sp. SIO2F4]